MRNSRQYGPLLPLSQEIDAIKYRQTGEDFYSKCVRIADALKDDDLHFEAFKDVLREQRFLPAGRVRTQWGRPGRPQPTTALCLARLMTAWTASCRRLQRQLRPCAEVVASAMISH